MAQRWPGRVKPRRGGAQGCAPFPEAQDAREALALLEQAKVDLLVSDVGLPGMNGRQLAELARARAPTLRVLFMTGYAEHARVRSSFLDKGMDLITKPFDLDVLADKVREMMIAD